MFNVVASEIGARFLSLSKLESMLATLETSDPHGSLLVKGLSFIHMYGAYEYTVRSSVQATLASLRGQAATLRDLRTEVQCLVLDAKWTAAAMSGAPRLWQCRLDVLERMESAEPTSSIADTIFPADGSHYRAKQLKTIWRLFGIGEPIVPDPRLLGRIEELVENRNAIAHGRHTPEDVGRRYSRQDIKSCVDDVEAICTHIVATLQTHFNDGKLLATALGP